MPANTAIRSLLLVIFQTSNTKQNTSEYKNREEKKKEKQRIFQFIGHDLYGKKMIAHCNPATGKAAITEKFP